MRIIGRAARAVIVFSALSGVSQVAIAQSAEQPQESSGGLDEIIVTAEKRSQSTQKTPISIVAITSDDLRAERIATLADVRASVPGLTVNQFVSSPQTLQLYARGQGIYDNQITFDPAVAVNLNGIYIGRTAGLAFELPGVERVEVLRGPQGTLYGRNTTGGAVNIITAKPNLMDFEGEVGFTYGNYNALKISGALDVPIVEDKIGLRISALKSDRDGWVKNSGPGDDFFIVDNSGIRADLRVRPTDSLTIDYSYDQAIDRGSPPLLQNIGGPPITQVDVNGNVVEYGAPNYQGRVKRVEFPIELPRQKARSSGHAITLNWKATDKIELRSITAWRSARATITQSGTGGSTPFAPFGTPVTAYPTGPLAAELPGQLVLTAQFQDDSADQFSQEFNILGDLFDGRIQYIGGLFYFNERGSAKLRGTLSADGITNAVPLPRNSPLIPASLRDNQPGTVILTTRTDRSGAIRNKSYAAFAQVTMTPRILEDRLHFTAGGRYTRDEREATCECLLSTLPPVTPLSGGSRANFESFKPTFTLAFDATPDLNVYVKYAEAFRSGGFNIRAIGNEDLTYNTVNGPVTIHGFRTAFAPENISSWEIGVKGSLLDRSVRYSLVAYDSTVSDAQVAIRAPSLAPTTGVIAAISEVSNAGKLRARGIEADVQAALTRNFQVSANYAYFDGLYKDTFDPLGRDISKTLIVPYSPEHSFTGVATYDLPLSGIGVLTFRASYTWIDDQAITPERSQLPFSLIKSYDTVNASIKLGSIDRLPGLEVSAWVKNLTDSESLSSVLSGQAFTLPVIGQVVGSQLGFYTEPRTFGVDVRYSF